MAVCLNIFIFSASYAQLNQTFKNVFDLFLQDQLILNSGDFHGDHFIPAAEQANKLLTPALNSLIATNISNFPLSSTVAGQTFDFSTGAPVRIAESLGPIFAETAETIGKRKINIGFNYSYLNLNHFRGLSTRDIRFTFIHEDNDDENPRNDEDPSTPSLGAPSYENDNIDVFLDLNVNAQIFAFSATLGITNKLDIGVAVPVVSIDLNGNARAVINSFTYGRIVTGPLPPGRVPADFEGASHRFGGTLINPALESETSYDQNVTGLGDIAVRLKYNFSSDTNVDFAVLADVRLPTGKEEDFLSTGEVATRISGIFSKKFGEFTPHLNLGYDRRGADFDSDEIEFVAGFDQKIATGFTFAAEIMGTFDVNKDEAIKLFPGSVAVFDDFTNSDGNTGSITKNVDLSNVPERSNDNTLDTALGFRYSPSKRVSLLGNLLVPLNDGGLRSTPAYTVGAVITF